MKHNITVSKMIIGPAVFVTFSVVLLTFVLLKTPKVLILHSYNTDYIWTQLINHALSKGLKERQRIQTKFFYMNSKRTYNKATELSTIKAIRQYNPNIILAFDDNAQRFLSKYYLESGVKIIFAGVNGGIEKYGYQHHRNITGVFERKSVPGITYILSALNTYHTTPDHHNVALLANNTTSVRQDIAYLNTQDWKEFHFSAKVVKTFKEWQNFILSLPEQNINYLLVSSYRNLLSDQKNNKYVDYKEVIEWTLENTKVPIVGINIFAAIDGFPIAVGSSAYEQVSVVLSMLDKIVYSTKKSKIPYHYPQYYNIAVNETALQKKQYSVPIFLKSFAASSHNVYK